MSYGKKVFDQTKWEMDSRRRTAEHAAQDALQHFYEVCPEAKELKAAMARNSAKIAKTVFGGGDVHANMERLKQNAGEYRAEFDRLLAKHGFTREMIEPQYSCADCKDTGMANGKLCHCFLQLERSIAYQNLSMSVPLEQSSFERFSLAHCMGEPIVYEEMEKILRACTRYAETFGKKSRSLLFRGNTGLGKTHLSLAIAGEVIQKGYGVIYSSAQTLAATLEKERFTRTEEGELTTDEQFSECDLLILDDLGTEFHTAYTDAILYDIINNRMLTEKPTIISTNLTMQELEKCYTARLVSRIAGAYIKMEFLGRDYRTL